MTNKNLDKLFVSQNDFCRMSNHEAMGVL